MAEEIDRTAARHANDWPLGFHSLKFYSLNSAEFNYHIRESRKTNLLIVATHVL
jgi:hypothetical protein